MALQFADIVNAKAYADCAVPGVAERLKFAFRPNVITPNLLAEFDKAKEANETTAGFVDQFKRFISWWDIEVPELDADGKPTGQNVNLPVNENTIGETGFFLLSAIMSAAIEAAKPGEASSAS